MRQLIFLHDAAMEKTSKENAENYLPKDFIETEEGLIFAAVSAGCEKTEQGHSVLCFLRYAQIHGHWQKLETVAANGYLQIHFPDYLHFSPKLGAALHAVPVSRILRHHRPVIRLRQLLTEKPQDHAERDLASLCSLFGGRGVDLSNVGVTGSLLIGRQKDSSDIDLVFYDREQFHQARKLIKTLIQTGELDSLSDKDWRDAYERRGCDLNFAEYVWHERRKFNKAMINSRKFDISYVDSQPLASKQYRKCGSMIIRATVTSDRYGFDYPALFAIDHPEITSIASFTPTYTGQAFTGEVVEAAGLLEESENRERRIVVGSSREAGGEYIKVVNYAGID